MAFPTTGILDTLKAGGALGANWTSPTWGTANTMVSILNSGASSNAVGNAAAFWNASTFTDVEIYCDIIAASAAQNIYLGARMTNNGTTTAASLDGYHFQHNAGTGFTAIRKLVNNVATTLTTISSPPTLAAGDKIGFSVVGSTLTAWYKVGAGAWTSIGTATDSTYTGAGNIGWRSDGQSFRIANLGGGAFVNAPGNTVLPVISGTAAQGQTLSTTDGTWTGSPSSYAYQWLRDGSSIGSATSSTYVVVSGDSGHYITCQVTATNVGGSTAAVSNQLTGYAAGPTNSVAPVVSGPTGVGSVLSVTTGTWS